LRQVPDAKPDALGGHGAIVFRGTGRWRLASLGPRGASAEAAMRVVIVGGGMAGLTLARNLARRGIEPTVLERAPATARIPGPIMLPFQAYDAFDEAGVLNPVRRRG